MSQEKLEGFDDDKFTSDFEEDGDEEGEYTDSEHDGRGIVYIDGSKCRNCTVLYGEVASKTHTCTGENGNANCPASRYRVVIGVDIQALLTKIKEATAGQDMDALVSMFESLRDKDPAVMQDFMSTLSERLGLSEQESEEDDDAEEVA
jgi:hypothetical protein